MHCILNSILPQSIVPIMSHNFGFAEIGALRFAATLAGRGRPMLAAWVEKAMTLVVSGDLAFFGNQDAARERGRWVNRDREKRQGVLDNQDSHGDPSPRLDPPDPSGAPCDDISMQFPFARSHAPEVGARSVEGSAANIKTKGGLR
jgi:hypothetical protein